MRSSTRRLALGAVIALPKGRGMQRDAEGMQMRTGIGIAVVVAIGLIWSVAVMSKWVPVASAEMESAAVIHKAARQ